MFVAAIKILVGLLLMEALSRPEYLHVLLNPLPVYGVAIGVFMLAVAMLCRTRQVQVAALIIIAVSSGSAWPAAQLGHRAHGHLEAKLSPESNQWLQHHEQLGDKAAVVAVVCAATALAAIFIPRKYPKATSPFAAGTLVIGIFSLAVSVWASQAGGRVRHEEFRMGPPPVVTEPHHHGTTNTGNKQETTGPKDHSH